MPRDVSVALEPAKPYNVGVIDLHSHVLPGLDDGACDLAESLTILRAMEREGVRQVAATPHVRDDWPTTPAAMEAALAQVRDAARAAGLSIDVLPGGEIAVDRLPALRPDELARFGLGGNPLLLLVEFPYDGFPLGLADIVFRLRSKGTVLVVAHPERNTDVQRQPDLLEPLVRSGAVVQLTASSLDGRGGKQARACAHGLLERGLAHVIASDAHAPELREAGLSHAVESLGDEQLGRWLTTDVPAALLASSPLPLRPRQTRSRWRRRLSMP